ncbi:hypothetical protein B0H65DRAFT_445129 [Neurospora tetraspora]|uniref:Uncharacterized protein n=1 Tax=Neurospora tetraspora TaxID=94610 RepID=A0AAE0J8Y4_9PEZI|nr:hypothetical protein B0H65DRAFT_445129 [Neurospora tetraspora]
MLEHRMSPAAGQSGAPVIMKFQCYDMGLVPDAVIATHCSGGPCNNHACVISGPYGNDYMTLLGGLSKNGSPFITLWNSAFEDFPRGILIVILVGFQGRMWRGRSSKGTNRPDPVWGNSPGAASYLAVPRPPSQQDGPLQLSSPQQGEQDEEAVWLRRGLVAVDSAI